MKRQISLVLLAALLPAIAFARTDTPQTSKQMARIELATEQIRQLHHKRSVKAVFASDNAFDTIVRDNLKRDNPDSEIDIGQRESVLLGLLKKSDSLRHILYADMSSQVIGLYDNQSKTLYVRNRGSAALGIDRHVIAHEYNHALQDQYYNLKKLLPDQTPLTYRNSDMVSARHALTEGDAVNTEELYIYKTYSSQELSSLARLESQQPPGPRLPKAIERQFLFPYTYGRSFAQTLYHRGGMTAVDGAFHHLPRSTYEIMHPAAYLKGWKPVDVALHGVQGMTDWKQVDDDVFGAFGYNLVLRQFLGGTVADRVTSAYRGDRYLFLESAEKNSMLFASVWTSNATARAARDAFVTSLKARYHTAHVSKGGITTVREKDGAVVFKVAQTKLTMAFAPTVTVARQLLLAPVT